MTDKLIWSYLIHLGDNMWGDFGPEYGGECKKHSLSNVRTRRGMK